MARLVEANFATMPGSRESEQRDTRDAAAYSVHPARGNATPAHTGGLVAIKLFTFLHVLAQGKRLVGQHGELLLEEDIHVKIQEESQVLRYVPVRVNEVNSQEAQLFIAFAALQKTSFGQGRFIH
eukprot:1152808-Pelagomonas_calceolata.AAC.1